MHLGGDDGIQKDLTTIQKWARQRNVLAHVVCFHENGIEDSYHRKRKTKHLLAHSWMKSEKQRSQSVVLSFHWLWEWLWEKIDDLTTRLR